MVVKHCVYNGCESDSRYWDRDYMKGVCFIRFPNPSTHRQRCEKWVKACDRPDLTINAVTDKTYICSKHFIGGNGPTKQSADPLPPNQLLAANQSANQMFDISLELTEEQARNGFLKSDLNGPQSANESKFITNLLNTNQTLIRDNQRLVDKSAINHSLNTSCALIGEVVDIDGSDNSADNYNNDSLLMPTMSQMTPQLVPQMNDKQQNSENSNHNLNNNHKPPEVLNNSLPLIIIPSTNQMIGSTFSVPFMSLNDKNWFNRILSTEFCLKLSVYGLSYGRVGQRVTLSAIVGSVVEKQLIVDISGHFDVKVFGLSICAKNPFYKIVPNVIQSEQQFHTVFDLFSKWRVCLANEMIAEDNRVFEDKIIAIRAFVCNITNTIRSRNCEQFLPESGSIRCKSCRILLNRMRKFKSLSSSTRIKPRDSMINL